VYAKPGILSRRIRQGVSCLPGTSVLRLYGEIRQHPSPVAAHLEGPCAGSEEVVSKGICSTTSHGELVNMPTTCSQEQRSKR
jgi:hypothetical protein